MNLWDTPGIPHKGWYCVDMIDLGEFAESTDEIDYESCEMCGREKIRYVHVMRHDDYGDLRVGCNCAGKMEDNYKNSESRDNDAKNRANRRSNFLKQEWHQRRNGNYTLIYKGDLITIAKSKFGSGYGAIYKSHQSWNHKGKPNMDLSIAKIAAFELFDEYHEVRRADDYVWENERW